MSSPLLNNSVSSRKSRYSLNVQIVGGIDRLIYDVDIRCPGSFHDATVWRYSEVKNYIETRHPRFLLAGDMGYPKSPVLITPFRTAEAEADPLKHLFNMR